MSATRFERWQAAVAAMESAIAHLDVIAPLPSSIDAEELAKTATTVLVAMKTAECWECGHSVALHAGADECQYKLLGIETWPCGCEWWQERV